MPKLTNTLCLILTLLGQSASGENYSDSKFILIHQENRVTNTTTGRFMSFKFKVPAAELKKVPRWDPIQKAPPLSRNRAMEIAKAALLKDGHQVDTLKGISVTLMKPNPYDRKLDDIPKDSCSWFFMIRFGCDSGSVYPASPDSPIILVTMSGLAVLPSTHFPKK